MRFQGSRTVKLQCHGCGTLSEPFRIYLYGEIDSEDSYWDSKHIPSDWEVDDEADLYADTVFALCPNCK